MKRIICLIICMLLLTGCFHSFSEPLETMLSNSGTTQPAASAQPQETSSPTLPPVTLPEITLPPETTIPETEPPVPEFDPCAILEYMTTEEKVGQLFLAACPDVNAVSHVETYHLGGYLLFGRDFEGQTPETMRNTLSAYQQAAKIPLLIAVDEEGGTVVRVSRKTAFREKRFPSPRDLYNQGGMELVLLTEEEKCALLKDLGINVNLAPVCDITTDPAAFMYKRSLGESPEITGEFAAAMVHTMDSFQIGSALKHFPGYGNNTDTHTGIARDNRTLQSLLECDLIPFASGIEAGCGAILVSHTIVECLDSSLPASLSPSVHVFLREEMGFEGVIITDDLTMDAITDLYGASEAAVLAVLAGNDLLCTFDYERQYAAVLSAVQEGRIPQAVLERAVCRVLQWKYDLGLLQDITE